MAHGEWSYWSDSNRRPVVVIKEIEISYLLKQAYI